MDVVRVLHRAAAAVLATVCATSTLLVGPLHGVAAASTSPLSDAAEWSQFLADHPELAAGSSVGEIAATCEAVLTCPAGLAVGAGGLAFAGTSAVLNWAFGSGGDDRNRVYGTPNGTVLSGVPIYGTDGFGGFDCNFNGECPPPAPSTANNRSFDATFAADTSIQATAIFKCADGYIYDIAMGSGQAAIATVTGGSTCNQRGTYALVQTLVPGWHTTDAASMLGANASYAFWEFDPTPNPSWQVLPHMICKTSTGTYVTEDGTAQSITPSAGEALSADMPACPAFDVPVVGYVTGGRTSDPSTQVIAAVPTTTQQTDPSSTTTTTTNPDGSTTTQQTGNNPDPGDGSNCISAVWSWDPVDWVYVPTKCALQWAFVPSQSTVNDTLTQLRDAWNGSVLGTATTAVSDTLTGIGNAYASLSGPGDCNGPAMPAVPSVGLASESFPFQTCTDPTKTWAAWFRPIASVLMVLASVWMGVQLIAHTFNIRMPGETYPEQQLAMF